MTIDQWLVFVLTAIGAVFVPGPGVLLTMAHSLQFGIRRTTGTILGCLSANLFHQTLVALGLGAVLVTHPVLLELLKYLGASYLLYAGMRQILSKATPVQVQVSESAQKSQLRLFIEGFTVMSLNPRSFLFFLAFFPLFVDTSKSLTLQFWTLGGTFALVGATALFMYASFASAMRRFLANESKRKLQTRSAGALMILSGFWFATSQVVVR